MPWPWFLADRRGPEWKQGWSGQTLSSLSLPPGPLLTVFAIVVLFLSLSWYTDYKVQEQRAKVGLRFLLLLVPVALFFAARYMFVNGRFVFRLPRPERETIHRAGSSPWGVAVVVVVLLLMISYHSTFRSQWFFPLWRSY